MPPFSPFVLAFAVALALFQVGWIFAYLRRRNDYADVLWGLGFPLVGWVCYFCRPNPEANPRALFAGALITIWGLRLFAHIAARNLKGHAQEDARYAKWRREWGNNWVWRSWLQVFTLQPVILFLVNLSWIWIIASPSQPLDAGAAAGAALWAFGFFWEAVGDAQLKKFKQDPANKGRFIETGLWRYSRHPNYFGEVVQWWGIYLFALGVPGGWMSLVAPLTITFFIRFVSGVPMLEAGMRDRPGFAEYARRVPVFVPFLKAGE